jgi:hypothetical protein
MRGATHELVGRLHELEMLMHRTMEEAGELGAVQCALERSSTVADDPNCSKRPSGYAFGAAQRILEPFTTDEPMA